MSVFTLRLGEQADVPRIMEIMSEARSAMADPPNNTASLHIFEAFGFRLLKRIVKPAGQRRYLMGFGFPDEFRP